jgi:hypothetical protein
MRNATIFFVVEIRGEKIHVERFDVTAPGSGQHSFQGAVALAVTLER